MVTVRNDLDGASRDLLGRLGKTLNAAGYSLENTLRRLPHRWDMQGLEADYVLSRSLDPEQPLDAFITLFHYQGSIARQTAAAHFSDDLLSGLLSLGLVAADPSGERYFSMVDITPYDNRHFFITDLGRFEALHQPEWVRLRIPREDKVMYIGSDTRVLAGATVRRRCGRVLDLCCGCGIHAILAAEHADQVVGVDLNPRALHFARMNAALNGRTNVRFLEGDLYTPVDGEMFDLILANPPFVATPGGQLLFRDGGSSGEKVLGPVIAGLPRHLTPDGTCQIVTDMVFQSDIPYRIKLRQWLGVEQGNEYDVLVVVTNSFDPFEYALDHESKEMPGTLEERAKGFSSRMECYEQMKVGVFRHGVITLRRSPAERQGWYHERYLTSGPVDLAPVIDQALQRIGSVERENLLHELSESRPIIREGTVLHRRQMLGSGGEPVAASVEVIPPAAVWQEEQTQLSEERLRLLLLCDGSRTVGKVLASAGAGPSDAEADRLNAAKQLLRLYEMGVIDL